jgi:ribosomal protein S18 acetylase RimI-like enzyme
MLVRAYREADEQEVVSLWREVFPDAPWWNDPALDIRRKLAVQRDLFLVAEDEGRVVGTAMGGYDGHRGWVYYVAVLPGSRRRGTGTALMRELEERLTRLGCRKLNLQVRTSNASVVDFYRSLGYTTQELISMGKLLGDDTPPGGPRT